MYTKLTQDIKLNVWGTDLYDDPYLDEEVEFKKGSCFAGEMGDSGKFFINFTDQGERKTITLSSGSFARIPKSESVNPIGELT